jgi:hypothetical protein
MEREKFDKKKSYKLTRVIWKCENPMTGISTYTPYTPYPVANRFPQVECESERLRLKEKGNIRKKQKRKQSRQGREGTA